MASMGSVSEPRTRKWRLRVVAALTIAASALGAMTAWAAGSPPEGPILETMALSTSDFARGAVVRQQGFQSPSSPVVSQYVRYFAPGARLGGQRLLGLASIVDLLDDAGTASLAFDAVRAAANSPVGRRAIAKEFIQAVTTATRGKVKVKSVT